MNNEMINVSKEALDRIVSEAVSNVLALNLENGIDRVYENHALPLTVTVEEMAILLKVSLPTAYELTKQKGFPSFHVGRKILINRQGLQQWIDKQCQGGQ